MLRWKKKQPVEVLEDIQYLNYLQSEYGVSERDLVTISDFQYRANQYSKYVRKDKIRQLKFNF